MQLPVCVPGRMRVGLQRQTGEIKSRQMGTLKCSILFISLERPGLGRPSTTHYAYDGFYRGQSIDVQFDTIK